MRGDEQHPPDQGRRPAGSATAARVPCESLLAALPIVVLAVGPQDELLEAASGQVQDSTVLPALAAGKRVWEALPEPGRSLLRTAIERTRREGTTSTVSFPVPARSGPRQIEVTVAPMDDGVVALHAADVSTRRDGAELLRQREEERLRLLAASPTVLYRSALRDDGSVVPLVVSENVTRLFGYSPGEVLVAGWWAGNIHPDDLAGALEGFADLVRNGTGVLEYRFRHRDGSWRLIRDEMWLQRGEDARPSEIAGSWCDLTAQRQAEESLREREARLRAILTAEPECVKLVSRDGWLEEMNAAGLAMLEAETLDEARSRPFIEYVEPEDREALQSLHARVMKGESGSVRLRIRGLRGTPRIMETQATPLRDAGGRVRGMLAVSRDVTGRHDAEEALRASRVRLDVAVATAGLGVWKRDLRTMLGEWDERMFVCYNRNPSLGAPSWEEHGRLVHPDDLPLLVDAQEKAVRWGERVALDYRTHPDRGPVRHLTAALRRVDDEQGRPAFLVGTVLDMTRQKELEEQVRQSQKLESIGRLAGGIAHDFNNLLTAILGHSELLEENLAGDSAAAGHVRNIRKSGERARDLTRQLLAFARRQVVLPRLLDLNAQLHDAQSMLRRIVGEDIELVFDSCDGLWPVLADPGQIEQIVLNLAVNARDAMPEGGRITLATGNVILQEEEAAAHPGLSPGPHVILSVTDTGTGMGADVLAHIFEPFFTTKPSGVGTGLGLATVYGVVRQSGGHIRVTSGRGEGTTFEIFLPRAEAGGLPSPAPELPRARAVEPGTETLLLVEDDACVRELVESTLTEAGYTVLSAPGPREALEMSDRHEGALDLLVTDVVMPGMNGGQLSEALIARRAGLKVLFMSGYPGDTLARHGIEEEGRAFLPKPFTMTCLLGRVREVLDGIIRTS